MNSSVGTAQERSKPFGEPDHTSRTLLTGSGEGESGWMGIWYGPSIPGFEIVGRDSFSSAHVGAADTSVLMGAEHEAQRHCQKRGAVGIINMRTQFELGWEAIDSDPWYAGACYRGVCLQV